MNTAWVLVFILWPGSNASTSFTIENLVSAAECERVAKVVSEWRVNEYQWGRTTYKCIEVVKK